MNRRSLTSVIAATSMCIGVAIAAPSWAEESSDSADPGIVAEPEPEPEPSHAPGMAPGEHGGWVAVDRDGNQLHGTIVCTPEVCGQTGPGSFVELVYGAGTDIRYVLKFLQDPVEAAQSPNGVGNVAGHNGGRYDHATGKWTYTDEAGRIFEIPLAYPGTDKGGNTSVDILLFDPTDDKKRIEAPAPVFGSGPDGRTDEEEAAFLEIVRGVLSDPADVQQRSPVVFTDAAVERRNHIGANIASAVALGSVPVGVQQAERLSWLYTWAAVRALPQEQRADVRADLRSAGPLTPAARKLRNDARELALLDVAASLTLTPLLGSEQIDQCAVALTMAQGRIARDACAIPVAQDEE